MKILIHYICTSMRPEVFPLSDNLSICTSTNRIWELFQSPKKFQIELFVTLAFHHNKMYISPNYRNFPAALCKNSFFIYKIKKI